MLSFLETQGLGWWIAGAVYIVDLGIRLWLLGHIPRNRKPTAAMAWLLFIFLIPMFGTITFFLIGNIKLSRKRRRDQEQVTKFLSTYNANLRAAGLDAKVSAAYIGAAKLAESLTGLAPTRGNSVEIASGYDKLLQEMTDKIDEAKEYVYVEFFIMALDDTTRPFFAAMERAVQRGGSMSTCYSTTLAHVNALTFAR